MLRFFFAINLMLWLNRHNMFIEIKYNNKSIANKVIITTCNVIKEIVFYV